MFEHRRQPLASRRKFVARVAACLGIAVGIDALAVVIGTAGYHHLEKQGWLTACANAAMVISGDGLMNPPVTSAGKVFSIFDALVGVIAFVLMAGVVLAPVVHRLLHSFHLDVGSE